MASHSTDGSEVECIREVIRLLNLALDDCNRYLEEAERAQSASQRNNRPELRVVKPAYRLTGC
jgi:hypothetical protein